MIPGTVWSVLGFFFLLFPHSPPIQPDQWRRVPTWPAGDPLPLLG